MASITFSGEALEKLLDLIERSFSDVELRKIYEKAARKTGSAAELYAANEYPPTPGRPLPVIYSRVAKDGRVFRSKFKSLEQQRWLFFALEHDIIKLPYRRTGRLGASVTHRVFFEGKNVFIEIGSNLAYAPFVIGDPEATDPLQRQSLYHAATGWKSLPKTVSDNSDVLVGIFFDSVAESFSGP